MGGICNENSKAVSHSAFLYPDSEQLIELAGRTCYKSEDKIGPGTAAKFINMVIDRGHYSVLEHASATFRIVCDRGISHEIVRHRLASYSQESTRYCNYGKDKFGAEISVIAPLGLDDAGILKSSPYDLTYTPYLDWLRTCESAEATYFNLLQAGVLPQTARSVLPTCLKTEIVMTCNFRVWRHFLLLRTALTAHPQVREIADMILKQLRAIAPDVFAGLGEK